MLYHRVGRINGHRKCQVLIEPAIPVAPQAARPAVSEREIGVGSALGCSGVPGAWKSQSAPLQSSRILTDYPLGIGPWKWNSASRTGAEPQLRRQRTSASSSQAPTTFHPSNFPLPPSNFKLPPSNFKLPPSNFKLQTSPFCQCFDRPSTPAERRGFRLPKKPSTG